MPRGVLFGLLAYSAWGVSPLFWRVLRPVDAIVVLQHRVIWGALVFFILLAWQRRVREWRHALRARSLGVFGAAGLLLGANWYLYLYAVNRDRVLEASLGYFINPLLNIVLGLVVFREKLRPAQWLAVAIAAASVVLLSTRSSGVPWIALGLAGSFGLYGLIRKAASADALLGSNIEMTVLVPVSLVWIACTAPEFAHITVQATPWQKTFLIATGLQTAVPLLWFSLAARSLPLSTLGFLQYLAPTMQFALAVWVFREPFSTMQLQAFALIWCALALFTLDNHLSRRGRRRLERVSTGS